MNWGNSMEKIYIGKVVSTHGIKGELRIISDFEFKDKCFGIGKKLIIDDKEYIIKSYRVHKNFDMVTLNDYKDINEVLFLLKKNVYVLKSDLILDDTEILDEDLIKFEVISDDGRIGKITDIFYASETNKILRVLLDKEVLIPFNSPMIKEINKEKKQVIVSLIEGM
jgi:16S rRNA processing protein RimM